MFDLKVHYGNGLLGMYYFDPATNKAVILGANDQFEIVGCSSVVATGCCEYLVKFKAIFTFIIFRFLLNLSYYESNFSNVFWSSCWNGL